MHWRQSQHAHYVCTVNISRENTKVKTIWQDNLNLSAYPVFTINWQGSFWIVWMVKCQLGYQQWCRPNARFNSSTHTKKHFYCVRSLISMYVLGQKIYIFQMVKQWTKLKWLYCPRPLHFLTSDYLWLYVPDMQLFMKPFFHTYSPQPCAKHQFQVHLAPVLYSCTLSHCPCKCHCTSILMIVLHI